RSARPRAQHVDAGALYARQYGQRSRALHRDGDQAAGGDERVFVGRIAVGVALGVRAARPAARRGVRGSAVLRLRDDAAGRAIDQAMIGPLFRHNAIYLGDQWRVGDWEGLRKAAATDPSPLLRMFPFP